MHFNSNTFVQAHVALKNLTPMKILCPHTGGLAGTDQETISYLKWYNWRPITDEYP